MALRIENILVNLIAQQTGFPQESITLQIRLLDDLNLDSIKAGEVIATAAREVGVAGQVDPTSLANATIQEIAEALRMVAPTSNGNHNGAVTAAVMNGNGGNGAKNGSAVALKEAVPAKNFTDFPIKTLEHKGETQVRDYIVKAVAEEFTPVTLGKHAEEKWQTANVLILCESGELDVAQTLGDQLHSQGAQVQTRILCGSHVPKH